MAWQLSHLPARLSRLIFTASVMIYSPWIVLRPSQWEGMLMQASASGSNFSRRRHAHAHARAHGLSYRLTLLLMPFMQSWACSSIAAMMKFLKAGSWRTRAHA